MPHTDIKYKLLTFEDNTNQTNFIKQNLTIIADMYKHCFMQHVTNAKLIEQSILQIIKNSDVRYFFAMHENKIVGSCYVYKQKAFFSKHQPIPTYTLVNDYDFDFDYINITYYPGIYALCKDNNYKQVGSFLLEKVGQYYKQKYDTKVIYLVPGSSKFINFYNEKKKCDILDPAEFINANKKLVAYYEQNNFHIVNNVYDKESCGDNNSIYFYVMARVL